jgi:hypothetical protein
VKAGGGVAPRAAGSFCMCSPLDVGYAAQRRLDRFPSVNGDEAVECTAIFEVKA